MTPKLNSEVCDALRQHGGPLEVQDDHGESRFVIMSKEEYRQLVEHEFRRWLQVGLDQEARGEAADWNLADVMAEAHRRYENRHAS